MKVNFILRNLTEQFYSGSEGSFLGLNQMTDVEKFECLRKKDGISMTVGTTNSFSDRVDLRLILNSNPTFVYNLVTRVGYRLATFDIN